MLIRKAKACIELKPESPMNMNKLPADIEAWDRETLIEKWHTCFGQYPPHHLQTRFMRLAIAWQIQRKALPGKRNRSSQDSGRDLGGDSRHRSRSSRTGSTQAAPASHPVPHSSFPSLSTRILPAVGSLLIREWQGKTYRVSITAGGYEYQGQTYRSLTAIAKLITGSHWSGPAFFGLNKKK